MVRELTTLFQLLRQKTPPDIQQALCSPTRLSALKETAAITTTTTNTTTTVDATTGAPTTTTGVAGSASASSSGRAVETRGSGSGRRLSDTPASSIVKALSTRAIIDEESKHPHEFTDTPLLAAHTTAANTLKNASTKHDSAVNTSAAPSKPPQAYIVDFYDAFSALDEGSVGLMIEYM